jgi:photosystem II stability/assembly factor-like uncharacterized protein
MRRARAAFRTLAVLAVIASGLPDAHATDDRHGPVVTTLTLLAGTSEGLWRSGDWGGSWERVKGKTSGVSLDALGGVRAIAPKGPQVWTAGERGLFFSEDFGETWAPLSVTEGISSLLLSRWPEADPTVFVGTPAGLWRSRNGGRTFSATSLAGTVIHRLEWPGPALVVACDRGLLITTDEGGHFVGPGVGLPEGPVVAMALSSYFAVDPVLFAAPASGGVYRSADGGKTYRSVGLETEHVRDLAWLGPFLYAAGETGFYRKDGVDAPWRRLSLSPGRPHRLLFPLAPAAGIEAFLATDSGVFHTQDAGEHWRASGMSGLDVLEIATFPAPEPVNKKRR